MDVSDTFFYCLGRGGGGHRFLIENPRRGVLQGGSPGREGLRGREGVCGELGDLGGGEIFFLLGAEMSTKRGCVENHLIDCSFQDLRLKFGPNLGVWIVSVYDSSVRANVPHSAL